MCKDLVNLRQSSVEALAFFEAFKLDKSSLELQVNQLRTEGFESLAGVIVEAEKLTDDDVQVIREIQASGGLAEQWQFPIRFIFCIRKELDVFYDMSGNQHGRLYDSRSH